MMYNAILFDLDNTLYDYDAYWSQRLRWSLEPVELRYPSLDIPSLIERAIAQHVYLQEWPGFLHDAGVHDPALIEATLDRYRMNAFDQLALSREATDLLAALQQRFRLGLITNGPSRTQRPKIAQFGLEALMDVIVVSEEAGIAKPDPAIFHLALQQLGIAPQQALFVGDSLGHDLRGAYAAGIDFVWMNPRRRALPPDEPTPRAVIASLTELRAMLKEA